jgi:hypothetical protein
MAYVFYIKKKHIKEPRQREGEKNGGKDRDCKRKGRKKKKKNR